LLLKTEKANRKIILAGMTMVLASFFYPERRHPCLQRTRSGVKSSRKKINLDFNKLFYAVLQRRQAWMPALPAKPRRLLLSRSVVPSVVFE
jgi:hypothetical protein